MLKTSVRFVSKAAMRPRTPPKVMPIKQQQSVLNDAILYKAAEQKNEKLVGVLYKINGFAFAVYGVCSMALFAKFAEVGEPEKYGQTMVIGGASMVLCGLVGLTLYLVQVRSVKQVQMLPGGTHLNFSVPGTSNLSTSQNSIKWPLKDIKTIAKVGKIRYIRNSSEKLSLPLIISMNSDDKVNGLDRILTK